MNDFSALGANDLAGCVAGCSSFLSTQNKGADFVQLLRKIAAEQGGNLNALSSERAALFIRSYEKKIKSMSQDGVLDRHETSAIFAMLDDELSAKRRALLNNASSLSQAELDRASYLGREAGDCREFSEKLAGQD